MNNSGFGAGPTLNFDNVGNDESNRHHWDPKIDPDCPELAVAVCQGKLSGWPRRGRKRGLLKSG